MVMRKELSGTSANTEDGNRECVVATMEPVASMKFYIDDTPAIRATPIDCLGLAGRSQNALKREGWMTVGQLLDNWPNIGKMKNVGTKSIGEIKRGFLNWYYGELRLAEKHDFWERALELSKPQEVADESI